MAIARNIFYEENPQKKKKTFNVEGSLVCPRKASGGTKKFVMYETTAFLSQIFPSLRFILRLEFCYRLSEILENDNLIPEQTGNYLSRYKIMPLEPPWRRSVHEKCNGLNFCAYMPTSRKK